MKYTYNMPYYYNFIPMQRNNGRFILPFALGFLSAPILLKPYYNQGYYYPRPYYPGYYPYYYN